MWSSDLRDAGTTTGGRSGFLAASSGCAVRLAFGGSDRLLRRDLTFAVPVDATVTGALRRGGEKASHF